LGNDVTERNELRGSRLRADYAHAFDVADVRLSLGGAPGALHTSRVLGSQDIERNLAFTELAADARQGSDALRAVEALSSNLTIGSTGGGNSYRRLVATSAIHSAMTGFPPLDLRVTYGAVSRGAAPFEQFTLGGLASTLVDPSLLTQQLSMEALPFAVAVGGRAATLRASTNIAGLSPFYWTASARTGPGRFAQWHRVVGVELTVDQSPVPVLGVPGARLVAGVGRSLDEPFRNRTRGYLTVSLQP
jgi:hypothetical protein